MNRIGLFALAVLLVPPASVRAQTKPSNTMHTRSAELYLRDARSSSGDREGTLRKAIEVLSEGDKSNPRVWLLMGQAYAMLEDVPGADSAFDKAQELWPEYEEEISPHREALWASMYNAGVASLNAGALDEATQRFETADMIYRSRPEALMTLGSLYTNQRDYAKAESAYKAALEVIAAAPEDTDPQLLAEWQTLAQDATSRIGSLLGAQQKHAEAAAFYRDLLAKDPNNTAAKAELALALSRSGDTAGAAEIYGTLLDDPSADEATLFNIGVGLYRAEQYDRAAAAFRRALERNPHSNETRYNLGQALYAAAAAIEEGSKDPAQLKALYEELSQVGGALTQAAPNNRNAWMMLAQAERSLADLEGEGSTRRTNVTRALEAAEALTFEVADVSMEPTETGVRLSGAVLNRTLAPGTAVRVRFDLLDPSGATVASGEAQVTAGAAEQPVEFTIDIPTNATVAGWKYQPIG